MPALGEIRKAHDVGYVARSSKVIWAACQTCGKERWVLCVKGMPIARFCRDCGGTRGPKARGSDNGSWRGGRRVTSEGYIQVLLQPDNFFYPMASKNGYVLEHRLVMAKHLGRLLQSWEIVHHKHEKYPAGSRDDKADNRFENLQLVTDQRHNQITILENKIKRLEKKIVVLTIDNKYLRRIVNGIK